MVRSPVGGSSDPAAMAIAGAPLGCQNSDEPHSRQNPRRTPAVSSVVDSYHVSPRSSMKLRPSSAVLV